MINDIFFLYFSSCSSFCLGILYCLVCTMTLKFFWYTEIETILGSRNLSQNHDTIFLLAKIWYIALMINDIFSLFFQLFLILLGNFVLVLIAWRIYGARIANKFGVTRGSRLRIEELRTSMSELQLPKEHDFKFK